MAHAVRDSSAPKPNPVAEGSADPHVPEEEEGHSMGPQDLLSDQLCA